MKKIVCFSRWFLVVTSLLMTVAGCADVAVVSSGQRHIINEQLALPVTQSPAANFNARIIFMADQLERNLDRQKMSNTVIVTSFANLNRLSETTAFGRLMAENLIHELQVRKWQVFEVRLTKDVIINEAGEFSLSRDIKRLKEQYKIGGIVAGTYSISGNDIIVNSRVIDINSGVVISSAQSNMPVDWFTESLLYGEDNTKTIKIVGDTPYSCRDPFTCGGSTSIGVGGVR